MPESDAERVFHARIAAHIRWGHTRVADRSAATAPARKAFNDRFLNEADPDGVMPIHEAEKLAENLKKAYYGQLGRESARSRRKKRENARSKPQPSGGEVA